MHKEVRTTLPVLIYVSRPCAEQASTEQLLSVVCEMLCEEAARYPHLHFSCRLAGQQLSEGYTAIECEIGCPDMTDWDSELDQSLIAALLFLVGFRIGQFLPDSLIIPAFMERSEYALLDFEIAPEAGYETEVAEASKLFPADRFDGHSLSAAQYPSGYCVVGNRWGRLAERLKGLSIVHPRLDALFGNSHGMRGLPIVMHT